MITGGADGVQLTWMDVKIGDWVVTPRHGKPVEIQALWVRALAVAAGTGGAIRRTGVRGTMPAGSCDAPPSRFAPASGTGPGDICSMWSMGRYGDDASLRPNQIYALALDDQLVTSRAGETNLAAVKERLLTPLGLRTLAPEDIRFCASYEGGVSERDGAYHQGTVWPFLLGPFVTAWVKTLWR